jgi:D-amino peptidase
MASRTDRTHSGHMNDSRSRPAIFVSADMEGCATIVHWDEVRPGAAPPYERARRIMAAEVNAALEGALGAGARTAVVNDAHSAMRNLVVEGLDPRARLVSGRVKPLYMLQGIEADRDALAFFIGYHGAVGDRDAVMGHTYSPRVIFECRLSGKGRAPIVVGELTINAALAGHYGVPVALVSGDRTTLCEAERAVPWAMRVETKRSLSYYAAECLSPQRVQEALRAAGAEAVQHRPRMELFALRAPITLAIDTMTTAQSDALDGLPGFSRCAARTVAYSAHDMASVYRALVSIIHLGAAAA